MQFNPQGTQHLQHRVVSRFRAWRERFVKAFPSEAGVFGELCHASRARHVLYRHQKHVWVGVLQRGTQVLGDGFVVGQVIGAVVCGTRPAGARLW